MWCPASATPAFGKLRLEDGEFEASMVCVAKIGVWREREKERKGGRKGQRGKEKGTGKGKKLALSGRNKSSFPCHPLQFPETISMACRQPLHGKPCFPESSLTPNTLAGPIEKAAAYSPSTQ